MTTTNINFFLPAIVIIIVSIGLLIMAFGHKLPAYLSEFISYLNLKPEKIDLSKFLAYSKFYENYFSDINVSHCFTGKHNGQEITFFLFGLNNDSFLGFVIKDQVSPMIISDSILRKTYEHVQSITKNNRELRISTKDAFLLSNILRSSEFIDHLTKLFVGSKNYFEFTGLNQILFITNHKFSNHQVLIDLFSRFIRLKEKLS